MVIKTYFTQDNVIVEGSDINHGFSQISELFYGNGFSRYLFQFDTSYILKHICNATYTDTCNLKHTLKIYNSGWLDFRQMQQRCGVIHHVNQMQRAIDFRMILLPIPTSWCAGRGIDNPGVGLIGDGYVSNQASNWFNRHTCLQWGDTLLGNYSQENDEGPFDGIVNGVYDNRFLQQQYQKYLNGEKSIIITDIHFPLGSENLEVDLTDYINNMLVNPVAFPNNGFMLCFDPFLEWRSINPPQVVNFFSRETSSWFEPHLTTEYLDRIQDNRADFYLDSPNMNLVFYSNIMGEPTNLNKLPTCTITGEFEDGESFTLTPTVRQITKGVYSVNVMLHSINHNGKEIKPNRMFHDVWSNLEYFNEETKCLIRLPDVELDFTTKPSTGFYQMGTDEQIPNQYSVSVHGINNMEKLERGNGEIRKVFLSVIYKFTTNQSIIDNADYKIIKREGTKEIDVINWNPVHKSYTSNFFLLDVDSLLPSTYELRFRISNKLETRVHNSITFSVINKEKTGDYS